MNDQLEKEKYHQAKMGQRWSNDGNLNNFLLEKKSWPIIYDINFSRFLANKRFPRMLYLRSLLCLEVKRVTKNTVFGPFHALFDKLVINRLLHKTATSGAACLALISKESSVAYAHSFIDVTIGKDNVRALST